MEMQLTPVTNRPLFMNKQLEKVTQSILKAGTNIQSNRYGIAALLAKVQSEGLFKDDGFGNASEYACQTFGMEKSLSYDLIKLGQQYTRPILNDKGKTIGFCSNLIPPANPETQDAPLLDFTPTQIIRFMTLGREKVLDLIKEEKLTPRMTIREILAVVKANKPPKALETSFKEQEPEQATEQEPEQATEQEPEQATEQEPATVYSRNLYDFDNVWSEWLIAELRKRGFKVYDVNGIEMVYDWSE